MLQFLLQGFMHAQELERVRACMTARFQLKVVFKKCLLEESAALICVISAALVKTFHFNHQ